jgi:hypothetical protein
MEPIDILDVLSDWVADHLKLLANVLLVGLFLLSATGLVYITWMQDITDHPTTLNINSPSGERLAQIIVIHPASVFPKKDYLLTVRYVPEENIDFTNVLKIDLNEDNPEAIKLAEPFSEEVLLKSSAKDDYPITVTVFNLPYRVKTVSLTLTLTGNAVTNLPIEIPINRFSPGLGLISMVISALGAIFVNFGRIILDKMFGG